jgi:hypothetical protein
VLGVYPLSCRLLAAGHVYIQQLLAVSSRAHGDTRVDCLTFSRQLMHNFLSADLDRLSHGLAGQNKQLIEINIMISFNELYRMDAIMNSKLFCLLVKRVDSELIELCGVSVSVDFVFMIMLGSKENSYRFQKVVSFSNIHNRINTGVINLQYKFTEVLYTPLLLRQS